MVIVVVAVLGELERPGVSERLIYVRPMRLEGLRSGICWDLFGLQFHLRTNGADCGVGVNRVKSRFAALGPVGEDHR